MKKKCIICGNVLSNKTKEHVIPQWLLKMTGDLKRTATFGIDYAKIDYREEGQHKVEPRIYPFFQFTFPACKVCNETFGTTLESRAEEVVTKILEEQPLSRTEIITLLDWFDKVRVGLWLGYLYYNNDLENRAPHFYIKDRIGLSDRALYIYKFKDKEKGINFCGPSGRLFSIYPSCFVLRINDYCFVNISKAGLLLQDLGFPYFEPISIDENGTIAGEMVAGTGEINSQILSNYHIKETSKAIFQPLFSEAVGEKVLDTKYVKECSIDSQRGIGGIFVKDEGIRLLLEDEVYSVKPKEEYTNGKSLFYSLGKTVSKTLISFANESLELAKKSDFSEERIQEIEAEIWLSIAEEKARMGHK